MATENIADLVKQGQLTGETPTFHGYEPFKELYDQGFIKPGSLISVKNFYPGNTNPQDIHFRVFDHQRLEITTTGEPLYSAEGLLNNWENGWQMEYKKTLQ
ncbi:hypothetical protein HOC13_01545 [Candidatus Woesearchaeota archaeon]|jgi:hypothetical protein|nr:hypothetical protein [Candidatus Woesearchaeota archaeon]